MTDFHNLKTEDCLKELGTTAEGLNSKQAEKRLKKYGPNELPKEPPAAAYKVFFSQFNNALVYILLITGALSIGIGAGKEAVVIFGAVLINVVIGFFQENKANNALVKLRQLVERKAYVLRGGNEASINSADVTVGDIIAIKAGNRIPADARILEASDLLIDESMLTGESVPAHKKTEPIPKGAALADRDNMAFSGTIVVNGVGKAVVTGVGTRTEIGKIAKMVESAVEERTPLQLRLASFSRFLGIIFGIICVLIVVVGLAQDREFRVMLETGVAVGVASIPEGLLVSVTFILALGMQRILKERALTRKLVAAETLGSTTVICTDKTGTLTEGKMHVAHIIIGEKEFEVDTMGSRQDSEEARAASLALQTGMMCNDAVVENPDDELASWRFIGMPTEVALLKAAIQSGLSKEKLLEIEPKIAELPFDSDKKYMISLHRAGRGGLVLYEKGAPEVVLDKAEYFFHQGSVRKLTPGAAAQLKSTYEDLTKRGLRLIALAKRDIKSGSGSVETGPDGINWEELDRELVFVGFIALKDPLRPEAKDTITIARQAGIRPVIITGDHRLTAKAIAREVGLDVKAENIMTGGKLDNVSDEELLRLAGKIDIYARVSPHHKLRIVKALQERSEVVAMTGDGINDSPALKAADIGISLGTGTDIAKETSDIVLLDNNFKTIVSAIKQGRIIFKNIRKVITYLVSDSFTEMTLITGSIIFNTPLAVLPAQILWINIVNDGFPHFSLAFEGDHGDVMKKKPLKKNEPLLNRQMKGIIFGMGLVRDLLLFALFYFLWREWQWSGEMVNYLVTLIFLTLGIKSLMSIFSLRSFSQPIWRYNFFANHYVFWAVGASFFFLVLSVYWPPLRDLLGNSPLVDGWAWLIAFSFGLLNVFLIEAAKWIFAENKR